LQALDVLGRRAIEVVNDALTASSQAQPTAGASRL
jgi:hypothetical protein